MPIIFSLGYEIMGIYLHYVLRRNCSQFSKADSHFCMSVKDNEIYFEQTKNNNTAKHFIKYQDWVVELVVEFKQLNLSMLSPQMWPILRFGIYTGHFEVEVGLVKNFQL